MKVIRPPQTNHFQDLGEIPPGAIFEIPQWPIARVYIMTDRPQRGFISTDGESFTGHSPTLKVRRLAGTLVLENEGTASE